MNLLEIYKLIVEDALKNLEKYVYDAGSGFLSPSDIEYLLKKYSIDNNALVYRGLFFNSKEGFLEFLKKINNNRLELKTYSSWDTTKSGAEQFARTKPTNNIMLLGRDFFRGEDERKKKREYTQGYGVILQTVAHKGKAIDVRETGKAQENEIILPAGKYVVKVAQVFKPHGDNVQSIDINQYIQSQRGMKNAADGNIEYSLMEYILHNFKDDITDKSKEYLYYMFSGTLNSMEVKFGTNEAGTEYYTDTLMNPGYYDRYGNKDKDTPKQRYVTGKPELKIGIRLTNFNYNLLYYLPLFKEEDQKKLKQIFTDLMFEVADGTMTYRKKYEKKYDVYFIAEWLNSVKPLLDKHIIEMLNKGLNSTVGKVYSQMSHSEVDKINNIKDPKAKKEALDRYMENMKKLLQKIA
jgi:hypothetical protein